MQTISTAQTIGQVNDTVATGSALERALLAYEEEENLASEARERALEESISNSLPMAVLFMSRESGSSVDAAQLKALFEASVVEKYQPSGGAHDQVAWVECLNETVCDDTGMSMLEIVLVRCANERGFDALRLMGICSRTFYLTSVEQVRFLDRMLEAIEERRSLWDHAKLAMDRLWDVYDYVRDELGAVGFTPDVMRANYGLLDDLVQQNDPLQQHLKQLVSSMARN
jgi:hypothetical protein